MANTAHYKSLWELEKTSEEWSLPRRQTPDWADYVEAAKDRLTQHGFRGSFCFEQDLSRQDERNTLIEYINYRCLMLPRQIGPVQEILEQLADPGSKAEPSSIIVGTRKRRQDEHGTSATKRQCLDLSPWSAETRKYVQQGQTTPSRRRSARIAARSLARLASSPQPHSSSGGKAPPSKQGLRRSARISRKNVKEPV